MHGVDSPWRLRLDIIGATCALQGRLLVLPLKSGLYLLVLMRFRLRTRTGVLSTLALANYSEFGLIVAAMAATAGCLSA